MIRLSDAAGAAIGYSSLSLTRSLEQLCSTLSFQSHDDLVAQINQELAVKDGSRTLFRGYLEQQDGDHRNGFSYSARSLTSALIVFDADGTEYFSGATVLAIVRTLATKVGLSVASAPTTRVQRFRLEQGEGLDRALHRLAETFQLVITDTAAGAVRAYQAPEAVEATWIEGQGTVTGIVRRRLDFSEWRDEWRCRGQREVVSPDLAADDPAQIRLSGARTDARRVSRRVLPNRSAVSSADAKSFVDWQAKKALAAAVGVTVTHSDWPSGVDAGSRVRVRVPALRMDEELIVSSMALEDGSTRQATATLVLPDTYSTRAIRKGVERRVGRFNAKLRQGTIEVPR